MIRLNKDGDYMTKKKYKKRKVIGRKRV